MTTPLSTRIPLAQAPADREGALRAEVAALLAAGGPTR